MQLVLGTTVHVKSHAKLLLIFLLVLQETVAQVGTVNPPIMGLNPSSVPGETELTQALYGQLDDGTYLTRGYNTSVPNLNMANTNNNTQVMVGSPGGYIPASELSTSSPAASSSSSSSSSPSSSSPSSGEPLRLLCFQPLCL